MEEAARRRLEEEEASPLIPQAGALPVIDVPSVLANVTRPTERAIVASVPTSSPATKAASERAARLRELKAGLEERAARLNARQIELLKDDNGVTVGEIGRTIGSAVATAAKKVKEVKWRIRRIGGSRI